MSSNVANSHFGGTVQFDDLPLPFRTHVERAIRRAEEAKGVFQDLGAMTIIASIRHWSERARQKPEIATELESLAEQVSRLDLPRTGGELQLLVRQINARDCVRS